MLAVRQLLPCSIMLTPRLFNAELETRHVAVGTTVVLDDLQTSLASVTVQYDPSLV